jgi:serine/threonine protein phosphatase 1
MSLLRRLFSARPAKDAGPAFTAPPAPDKPFFAIGDIHGSMAALERLLKRIEAADPEPCVICVGDYIDRGENSADVLEWLRLLTMNYPDQFVCLMGNHEQMCLRFLDDPERQGPRWFRNGGLQTLASYRVPRLGSDRDAEVCEHLRDAMGEDVIAWLRGLPLMWQTGNVAVVHAAADPKLPIDAQPDEVLRWGHPEFLQVPRSDGVWVVHGHTIVDAPSAEHGRIAVDTGAYATGRLTAAHVTSEGVAFLSSAPGD